MPVDTGLNLLSFKAFNISRTSEYSGSNFKAIFQFNNQTEYMRFDCNVISTHGSTNFFLDASDGLAAAVCHFFQRNPAKGGSSYSGWDAFIKDNPDKLK